MNPVGPGERSERVALGERGVLHLELHLEPLLLPLGAELEHRRVHHHGDAGGLDDERPVRAGLGDVLDPAPRRGARRGDVDDGDGRVVEVRDAVRRLAGRAGVGSAVEHGHHRGVVLERAEEVEVVLVAEVVDEARVQGAGGVDVAGAVAEGARRPGRRVQDELSLVVHLNRCVIMRNGGRQRPWRNGGRRRAV